MLKQRKIVIIVILCFLAIILIWFTVKKHKAVISSHLEQATAINLYSQCESSYNGISAPPNYTVAFQCFFKLAGLGNSEAAYRLSTMYYLGQAPIKSIESSNWWLIQSALAGNESAQKEIQIRKLAIKYDHKVIFLDQLFKQAESGDDSANSILATLFLRGILIPQSYESAELYALRAAKNGNSQGELILGLLYPYHEWAGYNESSAQSWWHKYLQDDHESNLSFRISSKSKRAKYKNE